MAGEAQSWASKEPDGPRMAPARRRLATLSTVNLLLLPSTVWAMVTKPTL